MATKNSRRIEANRKNSKLSTGPRTEAGKSISSMNARKHGMRAQSPTLPHENPYYATERADDWVGHYEPQSPGARHLVNACVAATLLFDRIGRYHAAVLSQQIFDAEDAYDRARNVDS